MLYDDIPDVLSQLVRTSFIPADGYKYIVADFSAIEARVLSWLAGEKWRMDVFANGGDISIRAVSIPSFTKHTSTPFSLSFLIIESVSLLFLVKERIEGMMMTSILPL